MVAILSGDAFEFLVPTASTTKRRPAHCGECGRFVSDRTVNVTYDEWTGEYDASGKCATHGTVDVVWERP